METPLQVTYRFTSAEQQRERERNRSSSFAALGTGLGAFLADLGTFLATFGIVFRTFSRAGRANFLAQHTGIPRQVRLDRNQFRADQTHSLAGLAHARALGSSISLATLRAGLAFLGTFFTGSDAAIGRKLVRRKCCSRSERYDGHDEQDSEWISHVAILLAKRTAWL